MKMQWHYGNFFFRCFLFLLLCTQFSFFCYAPAAVMESSLVEGREDNSSTHTTLLRTVLLESNAAKSHSSADAEEEEFVSNDKTETELTSPYTRSRCSCATMQSLA